MTFQILGMVAVLTRSFRFRLQPILRLCQRVWQPKRRGVVAAAHAFDFLENQRTDRATARTTPRMTSFSTNQPPFLAANWLVTDNDVILARRATARTTPRMTSFSTNQDVAGVFFWLVSRKKRQRKQRNKAVFDCRVVCRRRNGRRGERAGHRRGT